ncbi:MAG: TonB-dependent receptor [Chitinophagaceae bacterium]|nr:TonB-dependent receptor [Chitinophagaceae bacterium]
MKKISLLPILVLLTLAGFSQVPGGMGGARGGMGGGNMNIGRFYGKIVDAKTNKGIEAVSIQLVQNKFDTITKKRKDTVIAGMLTSKAGDFSLENLPIMGNFRLKISAIGYKEIDQKVAFEMKMGQGGDMSQALAGIDKDLGNIKLEGDSKVLESVTVTGSKPLVTTSIDRKVFNVEKNITSAGGTAVDVMRNVPSLNVDIDGNVTLRNNAPQIYVDGRPTTLTLEQIPADAIASVEVITNPSAKFDASGGTAGILNIVLKKNRKAGYNGNLRAGIDQRGKYNLGGDINIRQNKINVFASAMYNQRKSISTGNTDRLTLVNTPNTQLFQDDKNISEGYFAFMRGGVDYFIDNRNTLTLSGVYVNGRFKPESNSDILVDTLYTAGKTSSFSNRLSNSTGEFKNRGIDLGFKHNFAKAGKEWTADANFNKSQNENSNDLITKNYSSPSGPLVRDFRQLIDGFGNNKFFTIQTDYVDPLTANSKLELGARAQIRSLESVNDISIVSGGTPIKVPQLSSQYKNSDNVYAGYVTFSNKVKNFGYQLGLRAESSEYDGEVKTVTRAGKDTTINYNNNFPISLFPSIFLSQKLKNNQELQMNVSRRINRPNFFQLFPFTDYSDTLNLSRGNPNLVPEFTYSSEISYTKTYGTSNSFLASIYFKYTDNLITRYQVAEPSPINPADSVLINTYINANSSYVGGLELINRHTIKPWWDITTNLNLFTSKINITDPKLVPQDNVYSWFGKISNSFKLPKNFTIQLSGDYQSKTILPPGGSGGGGGGMGGRGGMGGGGGMFGGSQSASQGYIRATYGVDMAVRFDFMKEKRASLTLNFSDVFRTRRSDVYSESAYFIQNSFRRRDPQFFRLNFNWRFGKFDMSLFKRKNMKGEMEGMQNGMQGVQQ